jgi:hypothetical protein
LDNLKTLMINMFIGCMADISRMGWLPEHSPYCSPDLGGVHLNQLSSLIEGSSPELNQGLTGTH